MSTPITPTLPAPGVPARGQPLTYQPDEANACQLDAADPLSAYRDRFHLPAGPGGDACVYLAGNFLGLQPKAVRQKLDEQLDNWARLGCSSYFDASPPWIDLEDSLRAPLARLVGAHPAEVALMGTVTSNLHALLTSFYRPTPTRYRVVIEEHAFPSDRYVLQSHLRRHGFDPEAGLIEVKARPGEVALRTADLEAVLQTEGETVALVFLGGVNYYTGQAFDLARVAQAGRAQGCIVGTDLAHAVGNIRLALHDTGIDFATWCHSKYVNADPGGVAGFFVHARHGEAAALPRLAGWWGHRDFRRLFPLPAAFTPAAGAAGWRQGGPPILSLAALAACLEIFTEVGLDALFAKRDRLTGYAEFLLGRLAPGCCSLLTPGDPRQRGSQLSIRVRGDGAALARCLSRRGIVCTARGADVLRVALVPLYNTYRDVFTFWQALSELLPLD
jgi:kynureninase